jgi:hypothetical protein
MLFAGTGNAFYYSIDDGGHWTHFNAGLPAAPVDWIVVPKKWHDVVVSTYGRGLYILHDVTALEQGASPDSPGASRLFAPHLAFRQSRSGHADFTFEMPRADETIELQVLDPSGKAIRTMHVRSRAGLNRVPWDLHYQPAPQVALRTVAPDNPYIFSEPRFDGKTTRPVLHWGIEGVVRTGPIAAPGNYSVRLVADGRTWTEPFTVIRDPNVVSPDSDLVASTRVQVRVRDDMTEAVRMINNIELMRQRIADDRESNTGKTDIEDALARLDSQMLAVELRLLSRSEQESDDKYFVEADKLYTRLLWLSGEIGTGAGDVAGGADYPPTAQAMPTLGRLEQDLAATRASYDNLVQTDLASFNRSMRGRLPEILPQSPGNP